ncbi:unnamed protein product [Protopolystoma xenopodis]|uniref:SLED domain-containing protein n=1 Tax=Protopolystoma xenopodis TaxID=117903 RepID=A0A448WUN4_9PLAT|nr:unnamed protein product [Protopolystoma xenopodis]
MLTHLNMSLDLSNSFTWDDYIARIDGHSADPKCFKQHIIPPPNNFEVNSLLEAVDHRSAAHDVPLATLSIDNINGASVLLDGNPNISPFLGSGTGRRSMMSGIVPGSGALRRFRAAAFSLGRVVELWGPRVRVRLVGTDDRNDCFFLVDSDQIRPYPSGHDLQPPFGYMHNHLVWGRTLKRAIEDAIFASPSWFIKPPPYPEGNLFKLGDKLEAVDRRNAQLICPASIGAISGQHVLVSFDGWSGAFDYWTRFDSRDLFPVGWCQAAGHPLQPPGPQASRPKLSISPSNNHDSHLSCNQQNSNSLSSSTHTSTASSKPRRRTGGSSEKA